MTEASEKLKLYGWYSREHLEHVPQRGASYYSIPDGGEVLVTLVCPAAEDYKWPDKEARGEVLEWLRKA